jgi:poly(hydroxyalkanoate) depolymerase family esterase
MFMDEKVIPIQPPSGLAGYGPLALQPRASTGRWEEFSHGGPSGSRSYFVYTPAGYSADTCVPMVVMLHGCTQTAAESAAGTEWNPLADEQRFIVVYPQQSDADNPLSCWNWFLPEHQIRGSGEAAIIAGITQQVVATDTRWNVDPGRVYIAGLSAGGAMATIMGAAYPDLYAAIGVHSGLEYQAAVEGQAALEAMKKGGPDPVQQGLTAFHTMNGRAHVMPTIVVHSTTDGVVNRVNGDQVVRQWMETNRLASNNAYQPNFGQPTAVDSDTANCLPYTVSRWTDSRGSLLQEYWLVTGMDHAWSGGAAAGSYSDPRGPDATTAMWTFFSRHPHREG